MEAGSGRGLATWPGASREAGHRLPPSRTLPTPRRTSTVIESKLEGVRKVPRSSPQRPVSRAPPMTEAVTYAHPVVSRKDEVDGGAHAIRGGSEGPWRPLVVIFDFPGAQTIAARDPRYSHPSRCRAVICTAKAALGSLTATTDPQNVQLNSLDRFYQ